MFICPPYKECLDENGVFSLEKQQRIASEMENNLKDFSKNISEPLSEHNRKQILENSIPQED